jgi:cardiolipin synthase
MPTLQSGHQLQLLQGAQAYFPALIEAIDRSVHEVRLETYIFNAERSGSEVAAALERAAGRGVAVYLVMDGAGTPALAAQWAERFSRAGVAWHIFSPMGQLGLLLPSQWRRLHRKLCVVDGLVAFCGGANVLDDFYDPNHGDLAVARLDFTVRVTGPLVQEVHAVLTQFWWRLQAASTARAHDLHASWQALHQAVASVRQSQLAGPPQPADAAPGARAGLVLRDNLRHRAHIERAYRKAIGEATSEIIIANAYFLPGRKLRQGLIHAARRGVRVRLLLQGRYEYFMQYHAARPVYGRLLAEGVEIHEYGVSFLHAKVAVIDNRWATVGSSNLDPLSLLLAREANLVVEDAVFARQLRTELEAAMARGGVRVDPLAYANRPWRQRLLDRIAFGLMRLALLLTGKRY